MTRFPQAVLLLVTSLLAAGAPPARADQFSLVAVDPPVRVVPGFETSMFRARLTNLSAQPLGFTVRALRDIPGTWFSSLCSESECTIDSLDVLLSAAEEETLWVDVFPFGAAGSGTMEMRVRAHDSPLEVRSHFVGAIHGVTRLVVDDDGGASYEDYLVDGFAANGITAGVWPLWITPPRAADLGGFTSVYWLTGNATASTLTAADRAELTAYLDGGGRLLVSGQGLGADLRGTVFYRDRLGAAFVADHSGSTQVTGVAGDPIGNGLAFSIAGGSGANNQSSPDAIQALRHPVLAYGNGQGAGARVEGGGIFRSVYLAFGFEGVADAPARALLLDRIRAWLEAAPQVAVGGETAPPPTPALATALPNPSPGHTRILAAAPRASSGVVIVADAAGRVVARLAAAAEGAGRLAAAWDGRDLSGARAPAGVYFFSVEPNAGAAMRGRLVVTR